MLWEGELLALAPLIPSPPTLHLPAANGRGQWRAQIPIYSSKSNPDPKLPLLPPFPDSPPPAPDCPGPYTAHE